MQNIYCKIGKYSHLVKLHILMIKYGIISYY